MEVWLPIATHVSVIMPSDRSVCRHGIFRGKNNSYIKERQIDKEMINKVVCASVSRFHETEMWSRTCGCCLDESALQYALKHKHAISVLLASGMGRRSCCIPFSSHAFLGLHVLVFSVSDSHWPHWYASLPNNFLSSALLGTFIACRPIQSSPASVTVLLWKVMI